MVTSRKEKIITKCRLIDLIRKNLHPRVEGRGLLFCSSGVLGVRAIFVFIRSTDRTTCTCSFQWRLMWEIFSNTEGMTLSFDDILLVSTES